MVMLVPKALVDVLYEKIVKGNSLCMVHCPLFIKNQMDNQGVDLFIRVSGWFRSSKFYRVNIKTEV